MTSPNTIIADMQAEIDALRKERDELLEALEEITNVLANIGMTAGCYDDELNALAKGFAAIAKFKG